MGGEQAAGVLRHRPPGGQSRRGGGAWSGDEEADFKQPALDQFEPQSHPLYASPASGTTGSSIRGAPRDVVALSLRAALNAPVEETRFGVFRM